MVARMRQLLKILQLIMKILPIIIEAYDQFKPSSDTSTSRVDKGVHPDKLKVDSESSTPRNGPLPKSNL